MRAQGRFAAALAMGVAAMIAVEARAQLAESVVDSPHNLSAQTTATDEVCIFCHTPHASRTDIEAPLWNKPDSGSPTAFTTYDSSTIDGTIVAVGSVSAACLTCHDGTQAMDTVINSPGSGFGSGAGAGQELDALAIGAIGVIGDGIADLTRDLSNDHPVGAPYGGGFTTGTTTRDPDFVTVASASINGATRYWVDTETTPNSQRDKTDMILYNRSESADAYVECGSCHDPHVGETADTGGNAAASAISFMRIANAGSAVCLACHVK